MDVVGTMNTVTGLTATTSGSSSLTYNMPHDDSTDTGRTVTTLFTQAVTINYPAA